MTKPDQAKPLRSNQYLPKAGPKSNGGGRNQRRDHGLKPNEPTLFDLALQDKRNAIQEGKEAAKREAEAKRLQFRKDQAELAKSLLGIGAGPTRDIAELIIDNFVVVEPDQSKNISRTSTAELLIIEQLTEAQLKNKSAINNGKFAARTVLSMAFTQLTSKSDAKPAEAKELVTA